MLQPLSPSPGLPQSISAPRSPLQNDSVPTLLARLEGLLGPPPRWMLCQGRFAHRYYTRQGSIFERNPATVRWSSCCR